MTPSADTWTVVITLFLSVTVPTVLAPLVYSLMWMRHRERMRALGEDIGPPPPPATFTGGPTSPKPDPSGGSGPSSESPPSTRH